MSSVINNSNSNSALISTLIQSDNLVNKNIYSIKEIAPPHSLTYATNQPATADYRASGSCVYQLSKYGIISQILFNYKKTVIKEEKIAANDIFNVISKIDLLSSSRVISTLTSADLMAQFSNLEANKLIPIMRSGLSARDAVGTTLPTESEFCIPLVFGNGINNQLNSSFLEPLSIRVVFNTVNKSKNGAGDDAFTGVISDATLNIRYKNYNEESLSKILSENYSNSQLNQLNSRFYDENTVPIVADGTGVMSVSSELKSTDCVMNFYVIVKEVGTAIPIACKTLLFTGSGQEIMSLNQQQLQYARIDEDGFSVGQDSLTGGSELWNIAKIQTGLWSNHTLSNLFSLREINAPKITVTFKTVGTKSYEMIVVEESAAIFSTASASGRMDVALSN
jgi:hypothetical protein